MIDELLNIRIIVRNGRVDSVFSNNKNVDVDVLDFDVGDDNELEILEKEFNEIQKEYEMVY